MTPLRAALLLSLALSVNACTTASTRPDGGPKAAEPGRGEVGGVCGPPSAADIAACEAPQYSALGASKDTPVEWGEGAGRAGNFGFNRLQCADGSIAGAKRAGNVGAVSVPSTSPLSGEMDMDIVDRWIVTCDGTGERVEVFHNLYRCGPRCPPAGLRWEQEEELATSAAASALLAAGKKDEAVALLRDRLTRYPTSERVVIAVANTLIDEDEVAARALLGDHCQRGNRHACRGLGMMVMNTSEGATSLARACELGHKAACHDAVFSSFINDSLAKEAVDSSLQQLDGACSDTYPRACVYLAIMFKRSELPQDRWLPLLDRACSQGDSLACELMADEAKNAAPAAPADGKER